MASVSPAVHAAATMAAMRDRNVFLPRRPSRCRRLNDRYMHRRRMCCARHGYRHRQGRGPTRIYEGPAVERRRHSVPNKAESQAHQTLPSNQVACPAGVDRCNPLVRRPPLSLTLNNPFDLHARGSIFAYTFHSRRAGRRVMIDQLLHRAPDIQVIPDISSAALLVRLRELVSFCWRRRSRAVFTAAQSKKPAQGIERASAE